MANPITQWAAAVVGSPPEAQTPDDSPRVPKNATLYLHVLNSDPRLPHRPPGYQTQYQCMDCPMWIADTNQCTIHAPDVEVLGTDSCGYWIPGEPTSTKFSVGEPHGNVTPQQSGLESNPAGFSCKHCANYVAKVLPGNVMGDSGGCNVVDYNSPGDDPGMIHPDACCAGWTRDPDVGTMPADEFIRE